VLLEKGIVQGSGSISQVMGSKEAVRIIGDEVGVVILGEVVEQDVQEQTVQVRFDGGHVYLSDYSLSVGQTVRLRILARDVSLSMTKREDTTIQDFLQGVIEAIEPDVYPSQALLRVRCGRELILSRVPHRSLSRLGLSVGSSVWCQINSIELIV
jgi:molybdate transport system ATP-binding protein